MENLWVSPFLLVEGDLIVIVVEALNEVGYSIPSLENTSGALVKVAPSDPTLPPIRGSLTDET